MNTQQAIDPNRPTKTVKPRTKQRINMNTVSTPVVPTKVVHLSISQEGEITARKKPLAGQVLAEDYGRAIEVAGFSDHVSRIFKQRSFRPVGNAKILHDGRIRVFGMESRTVEEIFGDRGGVKAAGHGKLLLTPLTHKVYLTARVVSDEEFDEVLPAFLKDLGIELREEELRTDGGIFASKRAMRFSGVIRARLKKAVSIHKGSAGLVSDRLMQKHWGADLVLLKSETEKIGDVEPGLYEAVVGATHVKSGDSTGRPTWQVWMWMLWTNELMELAKASIIEAVEERMDVYGSYEELLREARLEEGDTILNRISAALASGLVQPAEYGGYRAAKHVAEQIILSLRYEAKDLLLTMGLKAHSFMIWVTDTPALARSMKMGACPRRLAAPTQSDSDGDKGYFIPCTPVLDEEGRQVDTLGIFYRMPVANGVAIARASELGIEEAVTCYPEGSARRAFCEQLVDEANWLFHTDIEGKTQPFMTAGLKIDAKDKVEQPLEKTLQVIERITGDADQVGAATYNLRWWLYQLNLGHVEAAEKAHKTGLDLEWLISGFKYGGGRGIEVEDVLSEEARADLIGTLLYDGGSLAEWGGAFEGQLPEARILKAAAEELEESMQELLSFLWEDALNPNATCTTVTKRDSFWFEDIPCSSRKLSLAVKELKEFQAIWSESWKLYRTVWDNRHCPEGAYGTWVGAKKEAGEALTEALTTLARTLRMRHHRYVFVKAMRTGALRHLVFAQHPGCFYTLCGTELPYVVPAGDWRDGLGIDEDGKRYELKVGQALIEALPVQFRDAKVAVIYRQSKLEG